MPRNFYPAVEKGVREGMDSGPVAGYPVVNVKVTLTDGSYHAVDSNEMSFKIASKEAFKKGILQGKPVLLEPVVTLRVTVPDNYTGDVMSDLNTQARPRRRHGAGDKRDDDHRGPCARRRGATLRHRSPLDYPGQGRVYDGVRALSAGAGAHRRPGEGRRREACRSGARVSRGDDVASALHWLRSVDPERLSREELVSLIYEIQKVTGADYGSQGPGATIDRETPTPAAQTPTTRSSSTAARWATRAEATAATTS